MNPLRAPLVQLRNPSARLANISIAFAGVAVAAAALGIAAIADPARHLGAILLWYALLVAGAVSGAIGLRNRDDRLGIALIIGFAMRHASLCCRVATGPILGLMDDDRAFCQRSLSLQTGDTVVTVTDGFTEARNDQEMFLGAPALAMLIENSRELSAEEEAHSIIDHTVAYARQRLEDDVAALVVTLKDPDM